jgi:hypothetical protein
MKTTHPTSIRKLVTLWDKSYDFTTGLKSFDKDSHDIHDVRFMSDVIGYINHTVPAQYRYGYVVSSDVIQVRKVTDAQDVFIKEALPGRPVLESYDGHVTVERLYMDTCILQISA